MSFFAPATANGFTLIESLISVSLLAILMGIALPSLEQHWQHARRQDAQNALLQLHLRQTQWRGLHADYASNFSDLAWPTLTSASPHYTFTVQQATAQSFALHAVAQGLQTRDTPCLHMSLLLMPDGSVRRTSNHSTDTDLGRCWPW